MAFFISNCGPEMYSSDSTEPSLVMIACSMTVPETCAVLAIAGYNGITCRTSEAARTLPPPRTGAGADFGGGGKFEPTPPIMPPRTPPADPPGTPPGTPPTTPTAPTSGGISSSLIMFTFLGITVGDIILPC